jgi:hypothetical protein
MKSGPRIHRIIEQHFRIVEKHEFEQEGEIIVFR